MNHLNYNVAIPWAVLLCVVVARVPQLWLTQTESEARRVTATGPTATPLLPESITVRSGQDAAPRLLYDAILMVESGGNDSAVGDGGLSRGPYQCGRAAWKDSGVDWDYDTHVWNRARCEYVMFLYWERWGAKTDEERARIWNGGPRGMSKESTLPYWRKVQQYLN